MWAIIFYRFDVHVMLYRMFLVCNKMISLSRCLPLTLSLSIYTYAELETHIEFALHVSR